MVKREKRRAIRVACSLPLRIRTRTGWLDVRVTDLSRRGLKLTIADEKVGVRENATVLDVARRLGGILPESIEAHFDPEGTIRRRLRVVRVGRHVDDRSVELGCLLDEALEDTDAVRLDVILPREGETWQQAERRLDSESSPTSDQPAR